MLRAIADTIRTLWLLLRGDPETIRRIIGG